MMSSLNCYGISMRALLLGSLLAVRKAVSLPQFLISPIRLLIQIQVAARKAQVWGVEQRERRQSRPSLKRRVGDLDGEDWEVRSKERLLKSRRGVS